MISHSRSLNIFAASLIFLSPALATPTSGGWLPVRVLDGVQGTHCIDRSKESVTIRLMRVVVDRQAVWFAEDKKADVLLNITLSGRTNAGRRIVAFPRAYASSFKPAPAGMLSVDAELAPISRFKLVDGDKVSSIRMEIFLSNESGNSTLSDVVLGIADVTKAVPLSPSAFTKASEQIGANIVTRIAADPALAGDLAKQVSLRFNFSPSGTSDPGNAGVCKGTYENTGTKAMIKEAKGTEVDGIVDISKFYCYRVVAAPSYKLQFAAPKPDGTCVMSASAWIDLNNPLIAFFVNADGSVAPSRLRSIAPIEESLARCRANGVSKKNCDRPGLIR